jgi:hypothetical protein
MSLLGKGVLAIWNGIDPDAEREFVRWHVEEHIPERVGLPGFLRGRRYVALDGHPRYFNFYETAAVSDLTSPIYRARLDAPSEWTTRVVSRFRDTSRTICAVAASLGRGEGAFVETLRLDTSLDAADFRERFRSEVLGPAAREPGVIGAHLLEGQSRPDAGPSAENRLRGGPDAVASWVVLVEAVEPDAVHALRRGVLHETRLAAAGAAGEAQRGLYALQYALTKTELDQEG